VRPLRLLKTKKRRRRKRIRKKKSNINRQKMKRKISLRNNRHNTMIQRNIQNKINKKKKLINTLIKAKSAL
jgi:hypothetical protein